MIKMISLRRQPEMLDRFVAYFAKIWGRPELYCDCMTAAVASGSPLPQWFLAVTDDDETAGCVGLITNDFISRMDLSPWLCALFVEEKFRCQGLGARLILTVAECAEQTGYRDLFCCTDHVGYYERSGFEYIGTGCHPWGETSRIYRKKLNGKMDIRSQFNQLAEEYDPNRRKFIPCFDDYYSESTATAVKLAGNPRRILDLGAGTGLLTAHWMKYCPDTEYVLTDIADEMLKVARSRFNGLNNVTCAVSDYIRELPAGPFDAVISALSIHHLEDAQKEDLFRRIHDLLPDDGWFFNYDQFRSADEALNLVQDDIWVGKIHSSGMSDTDVARWQERRKLDRVCSVEAETAMLRRSGFAMAECFFLSGKFAVFAAKKAHGSPK